MTRVRTSISLQLSPLEHPIVLTTDSSFPSENKCAFRYRMRNDRAQGESPFDSGSLIDQLIE